MKHEGKNDLNSKEFSLKLLLEGKDFEGEFTDSLQL